MLGRVLGDCEMKTIDTIPAPGSLGALVEVYGEPENAWYEWRIEVPSVFRLPKGEFHATSFS